MLAALVSAAACSEKTAESKPIKPEIEAKLIHLTRTPQSFVRAKNAFRHARAEESSRPSWDLHPVLLSPLWSESLVAPPAEAPLSRFLVRTQVRGDRRPAVWLPAGSRLSMKLELEADDLLRFAIGLPDVTPYEEAQAEASETDELAFDVGFQISWSRPNRETVQLFSSSVAMQAPTSTSSPRPWSGRELVISAADAGTGFLEFSTSGKWPVPAAFADPRILRYEASTNSRLNLIVYVIDTLRPDHLSMYGSRNPTSPRMDQLAVEGFRFDNFYAIAPWTRPTTATILTGYYPSWHGMGYELPLPLRLETMAESFLNKGYSTWAAVANPQVGGASLQFSQGFGRFVDHTGIGDPSDGPKPATSKQLNTTAAPWLIEFGDEPFFLYLHSLDPHSPYAPPPDAEAPFGRDYRGPMFRKSLRRQQLLDSAELIGEEDLAYIEDVYDNEVRYQDRQIGVLVDTLRNLELLEETAIVILSDHGEEFMDHGDWNHGYRMWEEQLRVPLVVWLPERERIRRGLEPRLVKELVSQVDLLPGLLDLFEFEDEFPRQGKSWLPLLEGRDAELLPLYAEDFQTWEGDQIGSFRRDNYKLIWTHFEEGDRVVPQLFDLAKDPKELTDLASERPELVRELLRDRDALVRYHSLVGERLNRAGYDDVRPPRTDAEPAPLTEQEVIELEALGYLQGHDD